MDIVTPCCGKPLLVLTEPYGSAYMQTEVPSEIVCTAEGCYNSWAPDGVASEWNEYKKGD